jgi:uncharacterized protein (DUF58 family)
LLFIVLAQEALGKAAGVTVAFVTGCIHWLNPEPGRRRLQQPLKVAANDALHAGGCIALAEFRNIEQQLALYARAFVLRDAMRQGDQLRFAGVSKRLGEGGEQPVMSQ